MRRNRPGIAGELFDARGVGDDGAHPAPLDAVGEVGRRQQRRCGTHDGAHLHRGESELPQGCHVGKHHEHAVAAPEADAAKEPGDSIRGVGELDERPPGEVAAVAGHAKRLARVPAGKDVEVVDRPVELRQLRPSKIGAGLLVVAAMGDQKVPGPEERLGAGHRSTEPSKTPAA